MNKIVIGSQFGDEGKGMVTGALARETDSIVVRFSGGQQAGHNVVLENGINHIHSTYGSGALFGRPTYISEYCTFYPIAAYNEYLLLKEKGGCTDLYLHPLTKITTPADVAYNIAIDKKALGYISCGVGVGKTNKRTLETPYKLYAIDLLNKWSLTIKLQNIYQYYYREMRKLNDVIALAEFESFYRNTIDNFYANIKVLPFDIMSYDFLREFDFCIFEGSQGILLDMDHGYFPYVTYSNTTSKNALEIIKKVDMYVDYTEIYYVTRAYQTRHGSGPMSHEKQLDLINNEHEINVYNDYQGKFKMGDFDMALLEHALRIDDIYSKDVNKRKVVFTCLDQLPNFKIPVVVGYPEIYISDNPYSEIKKYNYVSKN